MKKLMIVAAVLTADVVCAQEAETKTENAEAKPVLEKSDDPIVWGSGNYGMYSGYQLYGSLVNSEPTMQGYGIRSILNLRFCLHYIQKSPKSGQSLLHHFYQFNKNLNRTDKDSDI